MSCTYTLQRYWKTAAVYKQMLKAEKLGQFYKCMRTDCAFTSGNEESFVAHLYQHTVESPSKYSDSWKLCSYCNEMLQSVPQYVAHLHLVHGDCKNQCCYCFCRTPTISEALAHQIEMHPFDIPQVLKCFLGKTTTVEFCLVKK